ncbi:BTB/POZ and MATH domain-containing protein 1-like [Panicum virgatum]|uniref:BTB/POZ and MATH domain-containing protein 1-like n=1 Tax=Panicum virgatum TaxID=38727 RepID=UPI0019D5240A|nr:BTB/POZ and MATH domain-containing protein 1-like [Panicum virgatum]
MAPSQRPRKKMVSRCNPDTERGTLVFDIAGYSLLKGMRDGEFIRSASFPVGGLDWCIRYYPCFTKKSEGCISSFLELMSEPTGTGVMARFDLRLLNQATGVSTVLIDQVKPRLFDSVNPTWGSSMFKKISELEASPYLQNDRIVIECDITVVLGTPASALETVCEIQVPPSGLLDDLRKLLEAEKRTDIRFKVKDQVFGAHKIVLAMRSPVFEAELYGPIADKQRCATITVEDMQPAVFKALLHFIYTDLLPAMDDLEEDDKEEMVKHLLVAADRCLCSSGINRTSSPAATCTTCARPAEGSWPLASVEVPPYVTFHFINAYEETDEGRVKAIVSDCCEHNADTSILDKLRLQNL